MSNESISTVDVNNLEAKFFKTRDYKDLKTFEDYVQAGKLLIKTINCHQALLCQYALKVCTIRHGGISDRYYTITDFAEHIGMNKKTLQEWTLVYRRVIVHIGKPAEEVTKRDWQVASRVTWMIDQDNRNDNREKGTPRKMISSKLPTRTPEQVRKLFAENYNEKSFKQEAMDWAGRFLRVKNLILKRDLTLADEGTLTEIMEHCDEISDTINNFLTDKKGK